MLYQDGFFHADLHPGNLVIRPGARVGFIDLGMVGRLDEDLRRTLLYYYYSLVMGDAEAASRQVGQALLDAMSAAFEVAGERVYVSASIGVSIPRRNAARFFSSAFRQITARSRGMRERSRRGSAGSWSRIFSATCWRVSPRNGRWRVSNS